MVFWHTHRSCLSFIMIALAISLGVSGCSTVPQTGRRALSLVPSGQLTSMASSQFDQLKQDTAVSRDPNYNSMVRQVGEAIAYIADPDIPNADWEFVVFDDDSQVNAFAMPGGKVAVYTGLFKVVQTEDDLAVVIGHEVAHVAAGHGGERMSQQILVSGGAALLAAGTADLDSKERALWLGAFGAGTSLGVILPFSRYHESEADEIGLIYAAKAGYDPRAAIGFWKRMAAQSGGQAPPEFMSTHPSGTTRVKRLTAMMPKAVSIFEGR